MWFRQLVENKDKTISSGKKDDLNMWRLYGGNARGICMVFSFKSQQNSVLKKIQYVAKEDDIIKRLNQLMLSLKDLNINFFLDKYLNSTCIRIRLLQLPNIRKKFTNIFPGVLLPFSFYSFILLPLPPLRSKCHNWYTTITPAAGFAHTHV